jgi:hypothetical protein
MTSIGIDSGLSFRELPSDFRSRYFVISMLAQTLAMAGLISIGMVQPGLLKLPLQQSVSLIAPPPSRVVSQTGPPVAPRNHPVLDVRSAPKISVPQPPAQEIPAPVIQAKQVPQPVTTNIPQIIPAMSLPVHTGVFSTGSSAPPTAKLSPEKVQTGGLGDPYGAKSNPGSKAGNSMLPRIGSFDLPAGGGYGNGTGGSRGAAKTVESTGFGNGAAPTNSGSNRGSVVSAGFTKAHAVPTPAAPGHSATANEVPVEVLWKPSPLYTEEARGLGIEGEVAIPPVSGRGGQLVGLRPRIVPAERSTTWKLS